MAVSTSVGVKPGLRFWVHVSNSVSSGVRVGVLRNGISGGSDWWFSEKGRCWWQSEWSVN